MGKCVTRTWIIVVVNVCVLRACVQDVMITNL